MKIYLAGPLKIFLTREMMRRFKGPRQTANAER